IQFKRDTGDERVVVIWSRKLEPVPLLLPAVGINAQLVSLDGSLEITPDASGNYVLELPAAQPDNYADVPAGADTAIGGSPLILIESIGGKTDLVDYNTDIEIQTDAGASPIALLPTPGSILSVQPTTDPANDTQSPRAGMLPLPETSPATFTVTWQGEDNSGIASYTVWVRINGGEWQPWLETDATSADYTGEPGSQYDFDVWAVDLAGNWSDNVDLQPRATTQVQ
ncbi:MAG TPA: fibronectin type III domain-containing protein, partial [Phototrophicaceae bacterium]|nr:fibronectin type III domain-containing protein [Phototrophicaceae bacterium]